MQYRTLTHQTLADLRLERLRSLEIEHARHALRAEDAVNDDERADIADRMADLERRHAVHLEYAVVPEGEPDSDDQGSDGPEHAERIEPEPLDGDRG